MLLNRTSTIPARTRAHTYTNMKSAQYIDTLSYVHARARAHTRTHTHTHACTDLGKWFKLRFLCQLLVASQLQALLHIKNVILSHSYQLQEQNTSYVKRLHKNTPMYNQNFTFTFSCADGLATFIE